MALTDRVEIPRRTMVLFFVIDASGSMAGEKIGAVNTAIEEVIPELKAVSDKNADALVKVAALQFSSGVRWITSGGPVEIDQFHWNFINAGGVTDLGAACKALDEKLSTKAFMKEATGSFAPVIFLMSDGEPTDDWERDLAVLKQNNWFKVGIKIAVAIGTDANKDVLEKFTGEKGSVLETHNRAMLIKMIKFISVRSSQVGTKNSNGDDVQKQDEMNNAIQEFKQEAAADPLNDQEDW